MNRTEWQACNDPLLMLRWAINRGASERKLRLFVCAWIRRITFFGSAGEADILRAVEEAEDTADQRRSFLTALDAGTAAGSFLDSSLRALAAPGGNRASAKQARAARADILPLLRDLFDDRFRQTPLFLAWLGAHPYVERLARGIYHERAFGDLPILADALEEAGCSDEELLEHCRHHPVHARGCWALDAILGRS